MIYYSSAPWMYESTYYTRLVLLSTATIDSTTTIDTTRILLPSAYIGIDPGKPAYQDFDCIDCRIPLYPSQRAVGKLAYQLHNAIK